MRAILIALVFSAACSGSASNSPEGNASNEVSTPRERVSMATPLGPIGTDPSAAGLGGAMPKACSADACTGPAPALPNKLCDDGVSYSGPACVAQSDGSCGWQILACPDTCPIIDCAAPPAGCHYEGAVSSPCDQQTCGKLVCDPCSSGSSDACLGTS